VVGWAVWAYYNRKDHFRALQVRGMQKDFTWDRAAAQYEGVYQRAITTRLGR
jgi:starch synthase